MRSIVRIQFVVELLVAVFTHLTAGQVEIVKPYHPLYAKAGDALELICNSTNRLQLEWVRQTPNTSWRDTLVEPTRENNFITRYTMEEPSGNVQTTVIKKNMDVHDRGMYMCRDVSIENTFAVWVTVLKIMKTPDYRVHNRDYFVLSCNLTGFDSNFPHLQYEWVLNKKVIEPKNNKYLYGSPEEGSITLNVTNAARSDGGIYECTFFVTTSLGPLSFTEYISIDAGTLEASSAATFHPGYFSYLTFFWCLVYLLQKPSRCNLFRL